MEIKIEFKSQSFTIFVKISCPWTNKYNETVAPACFHSYFGFNGMSVDISFEVCCSDIAKVKF